MSTKKRIKLIYIDIYAALWLAKIAAIYVFLLCKMLAQKSGRVKYLTNFKSAPVLYLRALRLVFISMTMTV